MTRLFKVSARLYLSLLRVPGLEVAARCGPEHPPAPPGAGWEAASQRDKGTGLRWVLASCELLGQGGCQTRPPEIPSPQAAAKPSLAVPASQLWSSPTFRGSGGDKPARGEDTDEPCEREPRGWHHWRPGAALQMFGTADFGGNFVFFFFFLLNCFVMRREKEVNKLYSPLHNRRPVNSYRLPSIRGCFFLFGGGRGW